MAKAPTIDTLREHLFSTLAALRDEDAPMDIDRARAITDVAQVIINSAKVEVDHMRVAGTTTSSFIPAIAPGDKVLPRDTTSPEPGVLVHRMRG